METKPKLCGSTRFYIHRLRLIKQAARRLYKAKAKAKAKAKEI